MESCEHEHCHDVRGDIATEQSTDLTRTCQLEEAGRRHLGHTGLHAQLAVGRKLQGSGLTPLVAELQFCWTATDRAVIMMNQTTRVVFLQH